MKKAIGKKEIIEIFEFDPKWRKDGTSLPLCRHLRRLLPAYKKENGYRIEITEVKP